MATYTPNLGLKKPASDDFYNIEDFNANFDKIDEFTKQQQEKNKEIPNFNSAPPEITYAPTLESKGYYVGVLGLYNEDYTDVEGHAIPLFYWDGNPLKIATPGAVVSVSIDGKVSAENMVYVLLQKVAAISE